MTLLLSCGCDRTEYTRGVERKLAAELLQIGRPGLASLFNVSLRPPNLPIRKSRRRCSARARHSPFPINQIMRDRWMLLMDNASGEASLPSGAEEVLRTFFNEMSTFMINQSEARIS